MIVVGTLKTENVGKIIHRGDLLDCESYCKSLPLNIFSDVRICMEDKTIKKRIKNVILGEPNSRCFVTADDDKIYKYYKSSTSFNNEKKSYNLLKGLEFVPTIYEINDDEKCIVMERIKGKALSEGAIVPDTFLDDMLKIYDILVERGISDFTDFLKPEHIFVDTNNSIDTHGIRVIDFDTYPPVAPDEPMYNIISKNLKNDREDIIDEINLLIALNGFNMVK